MFVEKLEKLPIICLAIFSFLFPLFFLPWTRPLYDLNKLMLLYCFLPILGIAIIIADTKKKQPIHLSLLDISVLLFLCSFLLSTLLMPGNRLESLIRETLPMMGIALFYILIRQIDKKQYPTIVTSFVFSVFIMSTLIILQQLNVIKATFIGSDFTSQIWYPLGSIFNTLWVVGITIPITIGLLIYYAKKSPKNETRTVMISILCVLFLFESIILVKPYLSKDTAVQNQVIFLDRETGWRILLKTLENSPLTGIGPNNFIDAFTQYKPVEFNQTPFWNTRFTTSSNFIYYIGTVAGTVGLLTFFSMLILLIRTIKNSLKYKDPLKIALSISIIFGSILLFFFPASFLLFIPLFLCIALLENSNKEEKSGFLAKIPILSNQTSIVLPLIAIGACIAIYGWMFSYTAEIFAQMAVGSAKKGNAPQTLENLNEAIKRLPFREDYYSSLSQINIALAENLLSKNATPSATDSQKVTEQLQTYIKLSLDQQRKTTELSSQRSAYWENLAKTYRQLTGVVQNTLPWIVSSYEKAIKFDPNNPRLYVDLAGVYYGQEQYATSSALLLKAIEKRPLYNNAHYNLAHTYFKLKRYQEAVNELDQAIKLTNPNSPDLNRAKSELQLFQTQLAIALVSLPESNKPKIPTPTPTPKMNIQVSSPSSQTATSSATRKILIQNEELNVSTESAFPATNSAITPFPMGNTPNNL